MGQVELLAMVGTWAAPAIAEWIPPVLAFIYRHVLGHRAGRNIPSDPSDVEMGLSPMEVSELHEQYATEIRTMGGRVRGLEQDLKAQQETVRLLSENVAALCEATQASSSEGAPSLQTHGRNIDSDSPAEGLRT